MMYATSTDVETVEGSTQSFRKIIETATPGPWRAIRGGGDRYQVAAERQVIETDLAKPYADYLVCIRDAAMRLPAIVGRPSPEDLTYARRLAKTFAALTRAVAPEWLFVAPRADRADLCFMHNSAMMRCV